MYWTCASATNLADALVGRRRGQCWPIPPHARACNYFRRRGERASRGENHLGCFFENLRFEGKEASLQAPCRHLPTYLFFLIGGGGDYLSIFQMLKFQKFLINIPTSGSDPGFPAIMPENSVRMSTKNNRLIIHMQIQRLFRNKIRKCCLGVQATNVEFGMAKKCARFVDLKQRIIFEYI